MKDKAFIKTLVKIALPISLQSLVSASLTLLDNLMVSSLGEAPLAGVGLATQIFHVEWMAIFGFCTGCATFFTQFWGVHDLKSIRKVTGIALMTASVLGLIFFVAGFFFPVRFLMLFTNDAQSAALGAEYLKAASPNFLLVAVLEPLQTALRATKQTRIPMYISFASFFSDALLNYILIFGKFGFPALGVKGAAIATLISRVIETLLTVIVIFGGDNILKGRLSEYFSFDFSFAKRVYKNAAFTTFNETMWSLAGAAENAAYGHMGVTEYAAVQASITIMNLFQLACFSVGDASLILIGERLGRNEKEEAKKVSVKLIKAGLSVSVFMAVLLVIFNRPIISLFNLTPLGRFYAERLMMIKSFVLPVDLLNGILVAGVLRAGGDARFAAVTEVSLLWLYAVPATFIFTLWLKLPVYVAYLLIQTEAVAKLIILMRRFVSGKWMNNMIKGM